jgi:hypothetical protein
MLAAAGKKAGISALLVSFVLASTPAFAQTPPTAPSPAPTSPAAPPPSPPEGGANPAATPPPQVAPPELPTPPSPPPPEVAPPPPPPPSPLPPEGAAPMGPPSPVPAYIFWGLGGASLVVGGVFGIMALSAKSDFDDHPTYSQADTVHDRSVAADVGLGLGLVLAVSGTLFYFMQDQGGPSPRAQNSAKPVATVRVDPLVTPHTRGGALTLHF